MTELDYFYVYNISIVDYGTKWLPKIKFVPAGEFIKWPLSTYLDNSI